MSTLGPIHIGYYLFILKHLLVYFDTTPTKIYAHDSMFICLRYRKGDGGATIL